MKIGPKSKLSEVGVDSNIAQNHSFGSYEFISSHYWPNSHKSIAQIHASSLYEVIYMFIIDLSSHYERLDPPPVSII